MGLEPTTSSVTGWRSKPTELPGQIDGDNRTRTCDSLLVRQVLYQLSYTPESQVSSCKAVPVTFCQATRDIIHQALSFVKTYFRIFSKIFSGAFHSPKKSWAIRDSNPGPTGYEPVALTN